MLSAKQCDLIELPAAAIFRIWSVCDASRLIQERESIRSVDHDFTGTFGTRYVQVQDRMI
jgi:hypothetical protein